MHDFVCSHVEFLQHLAFVFLEFILKGVSGHTPEIVAIKTPFSYGLWMVASFSLKRLTYALSGSFDPCLMLAKRLREVAYLFAPWN